MFVAWAIIQACERREKRKRRTRKRRRGREREREKRGKKKKEKDTSCSGLNEGPSLNVGCLGSDPSVRGDANDEKENGKQSNLHF